MFKLGKVVWKDGMFIYPQHFQQQDIYYEELLHDHLGTLPIYNWGVLELEIDESFLKLNKIVIRRCIGVFPNGLFFSIPDKDTIPDAIEIPDDYSNKLVYLGVSLNNKCNIEQQKLRKNINTKYYSEEHEIDDINTQAGQKLITLARLNINLYLEDECNDQIILLPILRILDLSKGIDIDKNYIPPCLRVKSSAVLQGYANQILGLLTQYINMNEHLIGEGISNQNVSRVENALILQSVSSYKYLFKLIVNDPTLTPHSLLKYIVSMIGALVIFTRRRIEELVEISYNHLDLLCSFKQVINLVNLIFEELNSYISTQIDFKLAQENIYEGNFVDITNLKNSSLILGIEFADINSYQEHDKIFHFIKIASIQDIKNIISLQVSGVEFILVKVLPSYVSYNEKTIYLKLKQEGVFWNAVVEDKNMAVYLNVKFNKIKNVKLWMIPN